MDFEAWYAYTAERDGKKAAAAEEKKAAEEASRQDRAAKDVVAFKGWVNEVSIHDRALEVREHQVDTIQCCRCWLSSDEQLRTANGADA
jgi:hypothetical protein